MKKKRKFPVLRFLDMQMTFAIFLALAASLLVMQQNVIYESESRVLELLPTMTAQGKEQEAIPVSVSEAEGIECLFVWEDDDSGRMGLEEMEAILGQMRVPHRCVQADHFELSDLEGCKKVVLAVSQLGVLGEKILDLMDWVEDGGNLMFLYAPDMEGIFTLIEGKLGIVASGGKRTVVEGITFDENFLVGGEEETVYKIEDPFESSMAAALTEDCRVYAWSIGDSPTLLVWRKKLGSGTVVVDNLGFLNKAYRGIHCAAYSLMGDVFAWPVINGAAFYLDDFPSPVPEGNSTRVTEDYGMSIRDFYTQVWWNDMYNLAEKYGIRYTGMVIENYSDEVRAPFERNDDVSRYQYFGNMLLGQGGEIGLHGYNHMPLVLRNFDYMGLYDSYRQWESSEDMEAGLRELLDFSKELYPNEKIQVYVPPSNVLSEEGRRLLAEKFPNIRAIASTYLPGGLIYEQEFEEAEDGIIETPRTISGYIMDDFSRLVALSELNFHFVSSYFAHPDDVLDEDRGADLGWEEMFGRFSGYVEWLCDSAPEIRMLTGSELAAAVQRYDRVEICRSSEEEEYLLELDGFADEVWMLVRANETTLEAAGDGILTQLTDSLYLLKVDAPRVTIKKKVGK